MPLEVEKLYERACATNTSSSVVETVEIRERVSTLTAKVEKKRLELRSMPGFATEAGKMRVQISELCMEFKNVNVQSEYLAEVEQETCFVKNNYFSLLALVSYEKGSR